MDSLAPGSEPHMGLEFARAERDAIGERDKEDEGERDNG